MMLEIVDVCFLEISLENEEYSGRLITDLVKNNLEAAPLCLLHEVGVILLFVVKESPSICEVKSMTGRIGCDEFLHVKILINLFLVKNTNNRNVL